MQRHATAVLQVNKQLREETIAIYYAEKTFNLIITS